MIYQNKRIFIVEDEIIIAEDIKDSLENYGFKLINIFSSGEEVLQQLDQLKPDLVLMDIMLSNELNGIETADKIKKKLNIPIIFVTALRNKKEIKFQFENKFSYITKPYKELEIITAIEINFYRQEIENLLKDHEEDFIDFIYKMPIGVIKLTKDGRINNCNPVALKIFNKPLEDLINESFSYPFDSEESIEITIKDNDGKERFIKTHTWKANNKSEKESIIFLTENTIEKQLQLANTGLNKKITDILHFLDLPSFKAILTEKGSFLDANASFIKIIGIKSFHKLFDLNLIDIFENPLDYRGIEKKIIQNIDIGQMVIDIKDLSDKVFSVKMHIAYYKENNDVILEGFFRTN